MFWNQQTMHRKEQKKIKTKRGQRWTVEEPGGSSACIWWTGSDSRRWLSGRCAEFHWIPLIPPLPPPCSVAVSCCGTPPPRCLWWRGRVRRRAARRPGSGTRSSSPSSCSRWGRARRGRRGRRWCRVSSPAGSWAGRSPWTWSGWTTAPGSAASGSAAPAAATGGSTSSPQGGGTGSEVRVEGDEEAVLANRTGMKDEAAGGFCRQVIPGRKEKN